VVIAVLAGACGGNAKGASTGARQSGAARSATPTTTANDRILAAGGAVQTGAAAPATSGGMVAGDAPPNAAALPPDWIAGAPASRNPDDPRIMGCTMGRGTVCKMHVQGWYHLSAAANGFIEVAVYEDDATTPARSTKLPVPVGASRWFIDLPYPVSATARQVTVQASLLDPSGQPLFRGAKQAYRIP
jgi:hypothetical protein